MNEKVLADRRSYQNSEQGLGAIVAIPMLGVALSINRVTTGPLVLG